MARSDVQVPTMWPMGAAGAAGAAGGVDGWKKEVVTRRLVLGHGVGVSVSVCTVAC